MKRERERERERHCNSSSKIEQKSFLSSYNHSSELESEIAHLLLSCKYEPPTLGNKENVEIPKPKVSIIIPVYNSEQYLRECLNSLVNQTLREIEIICVYDKSTDKSLEILEEYRNNYENKIIILTSSEKMGPGGARNLGILESRADWIGFVDSDDIAAPDMFEKMYRMAIETECDIVQVHASIIDTTGKLTSIPADHWSSQLLELNNKVLTKTERELLFFEHSGALWTRLYRKIFLITNEIYFPQIIRWEDFSFDNLVRNYVSKIAFIPEILYNYRLNQSSITHTADFKSMKERIVGREYLIDEMIQRQLFRSQYHILVHIYLNSYLAISDMVCDEKNSQNKKSTRDLLKRRLLEIFPDCISDNSYRSHIPRWKNVLIYGYINFPDITTVIIRCWHVCIKLSIVQSHKTYLKRCKKVLGL